MWDIIYDGIDTEFELPYAYDISPETYNLLTDPEYGEPLNEYNLKELGLWGMLLERLGEKVDRWSWAMEGNYIVGVAETGDILIFKGDPNVRVAMISDVEAGVLLNKLAPYVGVSGAVSFEILKYLLGSERKKLQEWMEGQGRIEKYDLYRPKYL